MNPPPPPPRPPSIPPLYPPPPPSRSHNSNPILPPWTTGTTTTTTSTASDLPTALSTLTSLLQLSQSTLTSLPPLLRTTTSTTTLIPCPFNHNHHLPPSSLISHYLHCPSSPYPLGSHSISSTSTSTSNFFYSDCPAVVTTPNNHHPPPLLSLPDSLSKICANLVQSSSTYKTKGFNTDSVKLLPSEIWAIKKEVNQWRDYPNSYSYCVLRAILLLENSNLMDFRTWVVVNSPKYGVVIDFETTDHIVLLFKLCLKAIVEEAINFGESLFTAETKENRKSDSSFSCLILTQVLIWLGSQFTVLYGEVSGKFFAINMLKQCVLDSSLGNSILSESNVKSNCTNDHEGIVSVTIDKSKIILSQVTSAITALHERSILEEQIRALRNTQSLTAYQRMMEHERISKIAEEERKKRRNYKPVTEHDVFLMHQSYNKETNKMKTKEEILAEERDYKRRRMSYRGKKLKRSTTEKMRDIIEVYMEEMKLASGINKEAFVSETFKPIEKSYEKHSNEKMLESRDNMHKRESQSYHKSIKRPHYEVDHTRISNERQNRRNEEEYSRSPDKRKSRRDREEYSRSPDKRKSRRDKEEYSRSPDQRGRKSRHREEYSRSPDRRGRKSRDERDGEEYSRRDKRDKYNDTERKNRRREKSSVSEFEDRYNPV